MAASPTTISQPEISRGPWFRQGMAVIWAIALAKLIFHIYFNNQYGYFRDEFDYLSCGDHLQWFHGHLALCPSGRVSGAS